MVKGVCAAVAAALACAPATANVSPFIGCDESSCLIPLFPGVLDYTIPDDGQTYQWTFIMAEPGATFRLAAPNTTDMLLYRRTETGYRIEGGGLDAPFMFEETVEPNRTTIFVRAPKREFFCDQPGSVGEICGRSYDVGGNAGRIDFAGINPDQEYISLQVSVTAVPEPATWVAMVAGFGAIGVAGRRNRLKRSHSPS